jgi:hypothetical protein
VSEGSEKVEVIGVVMFRGVLGVLGVLRGRVMGSAAHGNLGIISPCFPVYTPSIHFYITRQ